MSEHRCPSETELVSFADADLSPEQLKRVAEHLTGCSACAQQLRETEALIEDLAANVGQQPLNVAEHVAGVMQRLDSPARTAPTPPPWLAWGGALLAAAAVALALIPLTRRPQADRGHFSARGGSAEPALSRDVGVQLYAREPSLRALGAGSVIRPQTPLTAGLRNLASTPAYLLLFAVDSRQAVHWIAPQFTTPGSDPAALSVGSSLAEFLLPSSVVFDDLAPGPLRVFSLITRAPSHVSEIEALSPDELRGGSWMTRFPQAEIRHILLEVTPEPKP